MATRKTTSQILVLDAVQLEEADMLTTPDYSNDLDISLCSVCGELLAWHDEACVPQAATPAKEPETLSSLADAAPGLTSSPFAYVIGQAVQPAPDAQLHTIIWRGQVKARHPRTGLIHRVNVYRLNNEYWDCYYEADLQAA